LTIVAASKRSGEIKGVIAVAAFTSYGAVARASLRRGVLSRSLVVPSYVLVPRGNDPIATIQKIAPRPLLIVHGEEDTTIPARMSRELFEKANDPKNLLIVPGAGHNSSWTEMGDEYVATVLKFLRGELKMNATEKAAETPVRRRISSNSK